MDKNSIIAILKSQIGKDHYIDVSTGAENILNTNRETLNDAINEMTNSGAYFLYILTPTIDLGNVKKTLWLYVLTPREVTLPEASNHIERLYAVNPKPNCIDI